MKIGSANVLSQKAAQLDVVLLIIHSQMLAN